MNKVLVIGSGGREHALSWKLAKCSSVGTVLVAPGNGGTQLTKSGPIEIGKIRNVELDVNDHESVIKLCKENEIALVVVGPEIPLVNGIRDSLEAAGIHCFGPSKLAARLEGSKAFSKDFMARNGIPTAEYKNFTDFESAVSYVKGLPTERKIVIKASGLAAGKGVLLPETLDESIDSLKKIMINLEFGKAAGDEVVIEERLEGPEISVFAFSDGENIQLLPASQDHKRALDGDKGLNTGGMGAFCPSPLYTNEIHEVVRDTIVQRSVNAARKEGFPFTGLLYCGIMLTTNGPKLLEYNCRFGDPETQVVLRVLFSDLFELMLACATGSLASFGSLQCVPDCCATCVVLCSGGYPGSYAKGKEISGLSEAAKIDGVEVFHAGTKIDSGKTITSGGRVLAVSAIGSTLAEATAVAYKGIDCIHFEGMHFRTDIAKQVLEKST